MNPRYSSVASRAVHRCEYCHAPEIAFNFTFEVEHVEPASRGGAPEDNNLALGCRSCNVYKASETTGRDPMNGAVVRLFNPRIDFWNEHFAVELDCSIVGKTHIARATIDRLRMNSLRQITARRQWRILQIFP
jgi:hypothetical protein